MARVDRFILLTKQMAVPLHVGNRPYLVMEGMCGDVADESPVSKPQPFSMLYTGRLNRRYGLELLLQAMKELQDPDIELWLCGSGEMEEEIRAYAAQDSRIRFFGFLPHEEAVQLQKQATVLVNPRTNQGEYTKYSFPSKTMEYMASGRPVMMFRLDGIPGEYDPFLTYIPEESSASIRDTVESLRRLSPSELDAMGARGRDFVLKNKIEMCKCAGSWTSFIRSKATHDNCTSVPTDARCDQLGICISVGVPVCSSVAAANAWQRNLF